MKYLYFIYFKLTVLARLEVLVTGAHLPSTRTGIPALDLYSVFVRIKRKARLFVRAVINTFLRLLRYLRLWREKQKLIRNPTVVGCVTYYPSILNFYFIIFYIIFHDK